ncbi:hypothetical protein ES703_119846 [subsurface metagenome]
MIQEMSDKFWPAEARTEEVKRFIKAIKRVIRLNRLLNRCQGRFLA